MNNSLLKIIWQRHKLILLVAVAVIIGSYIQSTVSQYNSWKDQDDYYHSKVFKENFYEEMKENKKAGIDGVMSSITDEGEEQFTNNFKEYQEQSIENNKVFSQDYYGINYYGSNFFTLVSLLTIFLGLAVFLYDNNANFNQALFSSRFTRKQIFNSKLGMFSLAFFTSHIIGTIIYLLGIFKSIPKENLAVSVGELIPSVVACLLLGACFFYVSVLAGIIMGQWLFAAPTVMAFFLSIDYFKSSIVDWMIIFNGEYDDYTNGTGIDYTRYSLDNWVSDYSNNSVPISQWISMVIIIVGCIGVSYWLFQQLSTDNAHQYLAFDFLKKPVLITAMIYIFFSVFSVDLYGGIIYEKMSTLVIMIAMMLVSMILIYVVFHLLIYRELPFKMKQSRS
ncbi:hypothetical protein [Vagococcus xieshaowenii]|uniref:ABC-2 type transport system permease protein n=1 Tax=Vagococcus xieshaowenii TaxID=2562451 RepID=A0A4Z0D6Q5_9ENTE|nr:hypothetical protein [Vagococcus xieshaowenii]QCA28625.1 hypothetical protein E4Z98_04570 [Vagococcus xieshaowenii]TFZ40567.1 hypothetical protein E4031_07205 [Vagococcus xieshaowenii]